jgi:hypothetical protein
MPETKNLKQYEDKLHELNKEGRHIAEQTSEKHKRLEGETADYGQKLHERETRRPGPKAKD